MPGGTIVLLDGLVQAMDDEEVLAVLGHELGQVVHRDGMRGIAQQMGLVAVAGVVWGDVSSLGASMAAGLQGLRFSRSMEADADSFAVTFLRRGDIPVRRLADAFALIEREETKRGSAPAFLSDHPATAERLRAAEAAAREPPPASASAASQ
jgi:Zn-dependent protease with chaperone function